METLVIHLDSQSANWNISIHTNYYVDATHEKVLNNPSSNEMEPSVMNIRNEKDSVTRMDSLVDFVLEILGIPNNSLRGRGHFTNMILFLKIKF